MSKLSEKVRTSPRHGLGRRKPDGKRCKRVGSLKTTKSHERIADRLKTDMNGSFKRRPSLNKTIFGRCEHAGSLGQLIGQKPVITVTF